MGITTLLSVASNRRSFGRLSTASSYRTTSASRRGEEREEMYQRPDNLPGRDSLQPKPAPGNSPRCCRYTDTHTQSSGTTHPPHHDPKRTPAPTASRATCGELTDFWKSLRCAPREYYWSLRLTRRDRATPRLGSQNLALLFVRWL